MELGIVDKVAIVTGAGHGIGRAIALRLGVEGAAVVAVDVDCAAAEAVVEEVRRAGGKGLALEVDVTDEAAVDGMVRRTIDSSGRIDILVNNAGGGSASALVIKLPTESWDRTIEVNLKSALPARPSTSTAVP